MRGSMRIEWRWRMSQGSTKRRKTPDSGEKHLTKDNWQDKTKRKNKRETDRKETGLSSTTRDGINVTSLFFPDMTQLVPCGCQLVHFWGMEEDK